MEIPVRGLNYALRILKFSRYKLCVRYQCAFNDIYHIINKQKITSYQFIVS